jgi:hypothetical protein
MMVAGGLLENGLSSSTRQQLKLPNSPCFLTFIYLKETINRCFLFFINFKDSQQFGDHEEVFDLFGEVK